MRKFIQELQRRNVIKSALPYLVVAWLLTQVMAIMIPTFELPTAYLKNLIIIMVVCFPLWVVFSWTYEITPEGLKKTKSVHPDVSIAGQTSNRLNYVIIAGLVIAIGFLVRNSFYNPNSANSENSAIEVSPKKSISVLAFSDMSPERDQEYFSDGISEEILNLLTKIPDLKVISRT